MEFIVFLLVLLLPCVIYEIIYFVFCRTHNKPLTDAEIKQLMRQRRQLYIKEHYTFESIGYYPDKEFKSSLKPAGDWYSADIPLSHFPSYASNLLKGKHHEWVILAYADGSKVKSFYMNKGENNRHVNFNISLSWVIRRCKQDECQLIMCFHNHPSTKKHLMASEQDYRSAKSCGEDCNKQNVNWLDFVCARGRFLEYARSIADNYWPGNSAYEHIVEENIEGNYLKLQLELGIFR